MTKHQTLPLTLAMTPIMALTLTLTSPGEAKEVRAELLAMHAAQGRRGKVEA